jgi:hypothetical protein
MAVPSAPTQPRDNRSILSGLTGETSVYSTLDTDALLEWTTLVARSIYRLMPANNQAAPNHVFQHQRPP